MSSDELAEIDGIKPKVYLADGEEKEVSSMTRYVRLVWLVRGLPADHHGIDSAILYTRYLRNHYWFSVWVDVLVVQVKRTWDHYYW
jgi:hypothetical protein